MGRPANKSLLSKIWADQKLFNERELRMLGMLSRMHSAWTATSIDRKVTFDAAVIHKAVSAESILRYCLRQRGWTKEYWAGKLSETDHVELLKDIAGYCVAWLNHEAKHFAKTYLREEETTASPFPLRSADDSALFDLMGSSTGCAHLWRGAPGRQEARALEGFRSHAERFFGRVSQFIREGIVAGAMGLLGPGPLTGEDLRAVDREVAAQEGYLSRFEQEVLGSSPPSAGEFTARASSYGSSIYGAGQRVARNAAKTVFPEEKRVLGDPVTEHCSECPDLAAMDWQPIGTLPAIGQTVCRNRCYCHFVYRFAVGGPEFTRARPGVYVPAE